MFSISFSSFIFFLIVLFIVRKHIAKARKSLDTTIETTNQAVFAASIELQKELVLAQIQHNDECITKFKELGYTTEPDGSVDWQREWERLNPGYNKK